MSAAHPQPPIRDWRRRELLTVGHAAALLSCSPSTVRRKAPIRPTCAGPRVPVAWVMEQLGEIQPPTTPPDARLRRRKGVRRKAARALREFGG